MPTAVYGSPPRDVIETPADAVQTSPLMPGSQDLGIFPAESFDQIAVLVPPGAVEARFVLAQALHALKADGELTAAAPKDKGGLRLKKTLAGFGCDVAEDARRHHRICTVGRPADLSAVDAALAEGAPRVIPAGLWSQPGVFSWDRLDPGTTLLLKNLPQLSGKGADFGAGIGWISKAVLASPQVTALTLVELDRRAVEASKRNVDDPRATILWADVRQAELADLDFVVMNPPFHDGGDEDRSLGQAFIRKAAAALRKGKSCWLVANRHLPYEAILGEAFKTVIPKETPGGYKVFEAIK